MFETFCEFCGKKFQPLSNGCGVHVCKESHKHERLNPPADVPRFVQVTDDDGDKCLVSIKLIASVTAVGKEGGCYIWDENSNEISCEESVETIISRIREVGGLVSGYEEVK